MAAIELPQLIQRLVLDSSGFSKGAASAEADFRKAANAAENAADDVEAAARGGFGKAADAADAAAKKSLKSWNDASSGMADVGKKMSTFITLPLVGIAAAAVKTAGDFESTLNTMAAVAGVPGPELKKLGDLAKKMGADTVFSANEAADAMLNLSKAGVSTADIMGGGVQATLALAAAGGLDLGNAATIAANAMNTFGLEGKDASSIADALAGAANASSADVSDLALALSQGGLAAHAAGLSLQETTAVLAAFADAGLKGSDAGTSLKTFLLNLVPSSKPAQAAMKDLGLSFVDVNGAMLPLPEIAQRLQNATKNLSDEQRTLALQTIFGTDAYRAALIISEQGAAGLANYEKATNDVGAAARVADARMQGWKGTWEQFKGSIETAALSIGEVVIPAITPLVDKVKDLADAFTNLDPKQAEFAVKLGGIAAAAGPALFIVGKLGVGIGSLAETFSVAPLALTGWGAIILAAAAALTVLWIKSETFRDVVTKAWGRLSQYLDGVWQGQLKPIFEDFKRLVVSLEPVLKGALGATVIALVTGFVTTVVPALVVVKVSLEALSLAMQVMASVAETVGRNLGPIWGGVEKAASSVWQAVQAAWDGISGAINDAWQKVNPVWQAMQTAWDGITTAANALWLGMQGAWNGITTVVVDAWHLIDGAWHGIQDAASALWQGVQGAWDGITGAVNGAWQVIEPILMSIAHVIEAVLNPMWQLLVAVVQDAWDVIQGVIGAAWDVISAIWDLLVGFVNNVLIPAWNLLRDTVSAVWDAIGGFISNAWNNVILPIWNAVVGFIDRVFTAEWTALKNSAEAAWDGISTAISFAWNNVILPVWNAVVGFIDGVFTTAWNALKDTVSAVWDGIKTAISTAWDTVKGIWGGIVDTLGGPLTEAFNTFKNVVSGVWDTFTSAADTAWGAVKRIIGASLRGIGNLVSGFLNVVGDIADVVGLNHVAETLHRGADAAGSWGEGMARGGAMGSPRAVGSGFRTDGPQAVVGEGNPMFPEYVIPTDPAHRTRATSLMLEAQDRMFPSHADGTNRLGVQSGGGRSRAASMFKGGPESWLSNVANFGADVLESVGGAITSAAGWTIDQVRKLGRAGMEKAWPKLPAAADLGGLPASGINTVREGVLDAIWNKVPPAPEGGGGGPGVPYDGSGKIGSGWQQITGYLDSVGQPYTITSTTGGEHAPGSYHYAGKAVDMVGDMGAIFRTLGAGDPVPGINELFYDPMGYFYDQGARQSGAIGGHSDHVHAATFDQGGIIWPGRNVLNNNTGSPEHLVPMAFGGLLPGPNPWENPYFNPGAWAARNMDEFATGVPSPDVPTQADLAAAPMWSAPAAGPAGGSPIVIAEGAFHWAPRFDGEVSPAVVEEFNRQVQDAIRQIIMAFRQGVK